MSISTIRKINNQELSLILKKYVSTTDHLHSHCYYDTKHIYSSNGLHLIKIESSIIEYRESQEHLFNPKTLEKVNSESYTVTKKQLGIMVNEQFSMNINQIKEFHKMIKMIKGKLNANSFNNVTIKLTTISNELNVQGISNTKQTDLYPTGITTRDIFVLLNAAALSNMIVSHKRIMRITRDKEITCKYTSESNPIHFDVPSHKAKIILSPTFLQIN